MKSVVTRINERLAKLGRKERLVRGRGYYYLHGGDAATFPSSGIYGTEFPLVDFDRSWAAVANLYEQASINAEIDNGDES